MFHNNYDNITLADLSYYSTKPCNIQIPTTVPIEWFVKTDDKLCINHVQYIIIIIIIIGYAVGRRIIIILL